MAVWAVTALWASLLLGASLVWPVTYGYDELEHFDMAYVYSAHPFHFYAPGRLPLTKTAAGILSIEPPSPLTDNFADAPQLPRGDRPTLGRLGGHGFVPRTINQMEQHPPLYYWLAAGVLRVPGVSGLAWDVQVWMVRLLSVLLMLPLPALCWGAARRLLSADAVVGRSPPETRARLAVLAAVLPLSVPNLIRDGSSVTNDALLILATSVLLYMLCRVVTGDLSRRTALWVAGSLAAALLTKGFALVLPPVVLAAYLVGGWKGPGRLRRLAAPLGIAAGGAVVGGLWWLRNLVDYGNVQVNGYGPNGNRLQYGPPNSHGTLGAFIPRFLHDFTDRIWGGIGIPDVPYPGRVLIYGWLVAVTLGVLAALVAGRAHARLRAAVLLAATVLTVALVAYGSFGDFVHWTNITHGTQGRYIYQTLVAVFALATLGWVRVVRARATSILVPVVTAGALATNVDAWVLILRSWYQPVTPAPPAAHQAAALHRLSSAGLVPPPSVGGLHGAVAGLMRWSPLPTSATVVLVVVLPVVTGVAALAATGWQARSGPPTDRRAPRPAGAELAGTQAQ